MTAKDGVELAALEKNTYYDKELQRVVTNYPFRRDPSVLTDNYAQAVQLARGLEKRLIKSGMLEAYNAQLREMLERECLRLLTEEELKNWDGLINYVSHHGVEKPQSGSTPLRIVANSSLDNNWSGASYKSCLIKGPNALTPLLEVLCTFRFLECIIAWDIRKAYNAVFIALIHHHLRRLVWRWGKLQEEFQIYALSRVHFGDRPAGLALQLAKDYARKEGHAICPETAKALGKGSYVDDSVAGGSAEFVERLRGIATCTDGVFHYTGTVAQIHKLV